MTPNTPLRLPSINFSKREIRLLDFSRTVYPRFEDGKVSCSMISASLSSTPPEYMIISHVPLPAKDVVDSLVVGGKPVSVAAGIVQALKTLSEQRILLSMSLPVRLWIEEVCVDHDNSEEMEYLQLVMPDIYKKTTGLIYHLGSGDSQIRTFLSLAHRMFWTINRCSSNTRCIGEWDNIIARSRSGAGAPSTLAEYSNLATHFFKHPFWNTMRSLQQYLSVKTVGLIYDDVALWDSMLLEVGMMVLQQEEALLPPEVLSFYGIKGGRETLLKGLRCWRRLVQWELARSFLRLHAEGATPLAWHYLAQLAPQLRAEDDSDGENTYLHLASCMLLYGHTWPEPLMPVVNTGIHRQPVPLRLQAVLHWLASVNKLSVSRATGPAPTHSLALDNMLSVSQTHFSESPLFFLTHAGVGFHDRPDNLSSWIPDYDAISRSPGRVPPSFEDPATYTTYDYRRCNPTIQKDSLVVSAAQMGQLVEVQDIPEPDQIQGLFAFLHKLPLYEVVSAPSRGNTLRLVKEILMALHRDPHRRSSGVVLHRCIGTFVLSSRGSTNLARLLFGLLDLSPKDEMAALSDRVRDDFVPGVGEGVTDVYVGDTSRDAATCLAVERIRDVRRCYGLGRIEGGSWELVPRGARVGDGVFKVGEYGAGVVLRGGEGRYQLVSRGGEARYQLVGACGIGVAEFGVLRAEWKRVVIR